MAIRVTPEPEQTISESEKIYSLDQAKRAINHAVDTYRRERRMEMFIASACIGILIFIIRLAVDSIITHPQTKLAIAVSPYIAKGVFVVGLSLLFGAIYLVFRRR